MRGWVIGLVILATATATHGEDWPYVLKIGAQLQIKSPGQRKVQPLETSTVMRYSVSPADGGEEVTIRGLALIVASEGKMISDVSLSRQEASFKQGEQRPDKLSYERAPKELKAILEQFDKPMARISTDAAGAEISRELLVPESSSFIDNGIVDNTRLFHPPFPADRDTWDAPARLSMGETKFAAGSLHYEKASPESDGTIPVKVSGELKPQVDPGGDIRDGLYRVTGIQHYNPTRKAWESGRMTIEVTLELQAEGHATGTASGTMELSLEGDDGSRTGPTPTLEAPTPAETP